MRERLLQLIADKRQVQINFPAAENGKLVSASGTIQEAGEDHLILRDIYGNTMIVPYASISYIEVKK